MKKRKNSVLDYFDKYLKIAPFSLAITRASEAAEIAKVKYKRPVLDIGCGFGEFAGVFFESQVEVGVDIDPHGLALAEKKGKYQKLFLADARSLPFADETFSTILSVSVLEHIPEVEKSLKEFFRVLKPGGLLVFNTPTKRLYDCLFYTQAFEKLRLSFLARAYFRTFCYLFKHVNLFSQKKWEKLVESAGFKIESVKKITPKKVSMVFDLFLASALPSQIGRLVFGRRLIWDFGLRRWFFKKFFGHLLLLPGETGGCILLVAQKPKRRKKSR